MASRSPTEIASMARSHTATCIKVLAGIVMRPDASDQSKIAAAEALLNRGWGRPAQSIEIEDTTPKLEGPDRVLELGRRITYLLTLAGASVETEVDGLQLQGISVDMTDGASTNADKSFLSRD